MEQNVRVRFAPSPTGGLHLGGVRTALYNYLFAKKYNGTFVLRVEDTDRTRFVPGAEDYIFDCLAWCGLNPDESPKNEGPYGPYRQSERKPIYAKYAEELIEKGYAYYAFDTPEELEQMRLDLKTEQNPNPQYDNKTRLQMKNSLSLEESVWKKMISDGVPYVVRFKMPENEIVTFTDIIRGDISNNTGLLDDKVLLKRDGMPTYHLAVVVDDYLMKITQVFRGEEWLPSTPLHILLWQYLGWANEMPQYGHLPLILKPDGKGKLSKRDGERLGFPVFAMDWADPATGEKSQGFKERGFLPEAFVNMLAMLGWNPGTEQEIFSLDELVHSFSIERVHKGGAKFDFEKALWYNHQHILLKSNEELLPLVKPYFEQADIKISKEEQLAEVIGIIKDRCQVLPDFVTNGSFFFKTPSVDMTEFKEKWSPEKTVAMEQWLQQLDSVPSDHEVLFNNFSEVIVAAGIKKKEMLLPLRVMIVGGKFGPGVFDIVHFIGYEETKARVNAALQQLK